MILCVTAARVRLSPWCVDRDRTYLLRGDCASSVVARHEASRDGHTLQLGKASPCAEREASPPLPTKFIATRVTVHDGSERWSSGLAHHRDLSDPELLGLWCDRSRSLEDRLEPRRVLEQRWYPLLVGRAKWICSRNGNMHPCRGELDGHEFFSAAMTVGWHGLFRDGVSSCGDWSSLPEEDRSDQARLRKAVRNRAARYMRDENVMREVRKGLGFLTNPASRLLEFPHRHCLQRALDAVVSESEVVRSLALSHDVVVWFRAFVADATQPASVPIDHLRVLRWLARSSAAARRYIDGLTGRLERRVIVVIDDVDAALAAVNDRCCTCDRFTHDDRVHLVFHAIEEARALGVLDLDPSFIDDFDDDALARTHHEIQLALRQADASRDRTATLPFYHRTVVALRDHFHNEFDRLIADDVRASDYQETPQ